MTDHAATRREVDERFARRTWVHTAFDPAELTERKRAAGASTSVVIPARDEAATIGAIVEVVRRELVDTVPLVDEVLVVDADSTDATADEARAAGARVVEQSQVLADAGTAGGKGEALWKGLHAATGDLIVYVDGDIVDFDGHFVVGLLGPLLHDPDTAFVKATYDRPFDTGDRVHASGGGRVTELLARPLLAAFWPELAWLAQPLSGEYAGRRSLLERLPFVHGYGVELALLIDIADRFGADVIAQVDLGRRVQRHQPLDALGRMAAEILAVAVARLEATGELDLHGPLSRWLAQPVRSADGALGLDWHEVQPRERPPLREWLARGGAA